MKNQTFAALLSALLALGTVSCGDDTAGPQFGDAQNPIQQFISGLTLVDVAVDQGTYIFGCVFEFNREGRITRLCAAVPNDDIYALTLWDVSDSTVITSTSVEADSGELSYVDITDVPVLNGSRVALTITSDDWYTYEDGGNPIYPAVAGDVTILGYGFIFDPGGLEYPNEFYNDYYAGVADLVFEPKLE